MSASITEVCEAVVQGIREWWVPSGNDSVSRDYLPDLNPNDGTWIVGRKVYVFPVSSAQVETATRLDDTWEHGVTVCVVEKCTETAADPSTDWTDTRIDFVDGILRVIGETRRGKRIEGLLPGLRAQTAEVLVWYDPEMLRDSKVFFSQVAFAFRRQES